MTPDDLLNEEQVEQQVNYWLDLADYDLDTARAMLASRRLLYVTFMCHQTIEKALKALYVEQCQAIPPRIHALVALAQRAAIYDELTSEQQEFLETLDPMNIECRYPAEKDKLLAALTVAGCETMLNDTVGMLKWIKLKLSEK